MMEKAKTVIVVGATGFLGMETCRQLAARKQRTKALVRPTSDPGKVDLLSNLGVGIVTGDLKDPASLQAALRDTDVIISTASSVSSRQEGDSIAAVDREGQLNLIQAARAVGVDQMVYISFVELGPPSPLQDAKRTVEEHLKQSGLTYTILRPTMFMESWLGPALGFDYLNGKATIYGGGANKISWISLADVAAFSVQVLYQPEARNAVIELGGPEALSPLEVVRLFERESGRKFQLQHVPEEVLAAQRAEATDPLQQSFIALMQAYAQGSTIDMKETSQRFPVRLTSVREYCKRVAPPKVEIPELL